MIEVLDGITAFGRFRQWRTLQLNLMGERFAQSFSPQQAFVRITEGHSLPNNEGYRLELFRLAAIHSASEEALRHRLMDKLMDFSSRGTVAKPEFDQIHRIVNRTIDAVKRKKGTHAGQTELRRRENAP